MVNGSRTYWLADGQQMAFDTAGLHYEYYDPLTGSIRYHGANNQNDAPVGIPMNVGWVIALSASYTLPAYVAGDFIALTGTVGGTLTLPAASSVQAGTGYPIANEGSADWTIALSGSDTAGTLYGNTTIRPIDRLLIVSDGAGAWHLVYRSNSEAPRFNGGITAASYNAGSTPGVSCSAGTVSLSTMVVTNGLVTHC